MLTLSEPEVVALCEQGKIGGAEIDPEDGEWVVDEDAFNDWWAAHDGRPFDSAL